MLDTGGWNPSLRFSHAIVTMMFSLYSLAEVTLAGLSVSKEPVSGSYNVSSDLCCAFFYFSIYLDLRATTDGVVFFSSDSVFLAIPFFPPCRFTADWDSYFAVVTTTGAASSITFSGSYDGSSRST